PLGHRPSQRLEADFGHIHVEFPEGRRLVPFLVAAWAYSNAPFVLALPFAPTAAILEGMIAAFLLRRSQGSLVGQPKDRCHADPLGSRASVSSPLRGAGKSLPLRSAFLHASPGQREARRRRDRQGRAEAICHTGASGGRSRRTEQIFSQ